MRLRFASGFSVLLTGLQAGLGILVVFLYGSNGVYAQDTVQSVPSAAIATSSEWLTKLSDAFVKDIEAGDIETAALHHIQLQAAILLATDPQGQESAMSKKLRNQLIQTASAKSTGFIPNNTAVTGPLLDGALLIRSAISNQDWNATKQAIGNLSLPLAHVMAAQASESLGKPTAAGTPSPSEPDPHFMVGLLRKVQDSLRNDDVLTAESYAPQLLQMTKQWCDPTAQKLCYSDGVSAAYDALGRGAFLRGDFDGAKQYFLESVTLPAGSILIGGPSLKLAEALFSKGYSAEVIQFLDQAKNVWSSPLPDKWIGVIRNGGHPNFKAVTYR